MKHLENVVQRHNLNRSILVQAQRSGDPAEGIKAVARRLFPAASATEADHREAAWQTLVSLIEGQRLGRFLGNRSSKAIYSCRYFSLAVITSMSRSEIRLYLAGSYDQSVRVGRWGRDDSRISSGFVGKWKLVPEGRRNYDGLWGGE